MGLYCSHDIAVAPHFSECSGVFGTEAPWANPDDFCFLKTSSKWHLHCHCLPNILSKFRFSPLSQPLPLPPSPLSWQSFEGADSLLHRMILYSFVFSWHLWNRQKQTAKNRHIYLHLLRLCRQAIQSISRPLGPVGVAIIELLLRMKNIVSLITYYIILLSLPRVWVYKYCHFALEPIYVELTVWLCCLIHRHVALFFYGL